MSSKLKTNSMIGRIKKILLGLIIALAVFVLGFFIYTLDYYHADEEAYSYLDGNNSAGITIIKEDKTIVFKPENPKAGIIFYPGAKVEAEAYAPIMYKCAEKGILCIIKKVPHNLAVLGINDADGIENEYSEITDWYMAGHSLGGAMASDYIAKNQSDYDGLILLGAYSDADLSESDLRVLSIYGSEDGVLNREKYAEKMVNIKKLTEYIIEGGCHAYFGSYGEQKGDGTATISPEDQWDETAGVIENFVLGE